MNITAYTRKKIEKGLEQAKKRNDQDPEIARLLFAPRKINDKNFSEVCDIYSQVLNEDFDTVVIVESHPGSAEKKLPMPSFKFVETSLGIVYANDRLRNDFADEDDDFFINDDAFDGDTGLYDQLMMLQNILENFSVLYIQMTDESPTIVKELAFALEEILASKQALIVFCCEMVENQSEILEKVVEYQKGQDLSTLMNYLNKHNSLFDGTGTFAAGLIVAQKWGLKVRFNALENGLDQTKNNLNGFAVMKEQPMFG